MFTIHQGINGGWYGCVTATDPLAVKTAALALSEILAQLRSERPKASAKPVTSVSAKPGAEPQPDLNDAGMACLDYLALNPRATHDEYVAAGHTLRTVKWLRVNAFLTNDPTGAFVVHYP